MLFSDGLLAVKRAVAFCELGVDEIAGTLGRVDPRAFLLCDVWTYFSSATSLRRFITQDLRSAEFPWWSALRTLRTMPGARSPVLDHLGIENAADDIVLFPHPAMILYATATDHDDRVFLQL